MGNSEKYEYNNSSELMEENVTTNGYKFSINYAYDDAGNRISAKETGYNRGVQITYSYDKNNRLVSTNEIKEGYIYKTDYTYDNNGNQTRVEKYRKNDDGVFRLNIEIPYTGTKVGNDEKFEYNGLNQLVDYESLAGSYNNKLGYSSEYKYMPNGYRLSKDVNGITTKFLWDGDNIVAELNSANAITKSYYRGKNLMSGSSSGYYMPDVHGNIIEQYDGSNSYPKNYFAYDAFGGNDWFEDYEPLNNYNTWGYCGQYYDFETGNYYMRARYYNPHTGRFITEDPIKDGLNWYAYCGNNPVNLVDPSGLSLKVNNYKRNDSSSLVNTTEINYLKRDLNELLKDENGISAGIVKISDYGNISLEMYDSDCNLPGYKLLNQIINNTDEEIFIEVMNGKTEKYHSGYSVTEDYNKYKFDQNTILYNYASTDDVIIADDSKGMANRTFRTEKSIGYTSLGHELIHAYRDITGQRPRYGIVSYTGIAPPYASSDGLNSEEFETVGLVGWSNEGYYGRITENDIRRQRGLPLRGWYS